MTALQITSMKNFMSKLLTSDAFDSFLLEEAHISMANDYAIDGHINQDFFCGEEESAKYEFRPWSEIKGLCFDLIKGRRTPLSFRFVLHLMPEKAAALLEKGNCDVAPALIKALVLTIRYDGAKAVLTTGTSFHTFIPSKEPDIIWDRALTTFLEQKEITFSSLA